jgi:hypothetical protein
VRQHELAVAQVADVNLNSGHAELDRVRDGRQGVFFAAAAVGSAVSDYGRL